LPAERLRRVEVDMSRTTGPLRIAASCLATLLMLNVAGAAAAESPATDGFITGAAAQAWEKWQTAMQAILERSMDKAEAAFGDLAALEPSAFSLALLADHTVQRTALGGAVLLFEQDLEAKALGANGQKIAELLVAGREQRNEADDGWYFCQVGRFDVADANFKALLAANPDPVALLEFTDQIRKRREILIQLIDNPAVGESVRAILKLLDRGELAIKADPTRIKENIERLGGPPRGFENAVAALKDSGEYAIPFIVQYLRNPAKKDLMQPILRCLPLIDRPALNPLVIALRMDDQATKRYLIQALGKIGYMQAAPYLLQLVQSDLGAPEVKEAATAALEALRSRGLEVDPGLPAAQAFRQLAEDYYADQGSLAADVRLEAANVWYWRDDLLQNVPVPTLVFNEIMCMRCCEEALRLDPQMKPALSLWLAANFRREAQLGFDEKDQTRPEKYPPASYFAQAAGAEYCLRALSRALDTADPSVALGAIDALRVTAGPASLVADADGRLPLAQALSSPDRMVRIRAALTLGHARPEKTFANYQNLMPVLSEALMMHGGARNALVVDADAGSANAAAAALREQGYEVLEGAALYVGLQKVRDTLPGLDVIFLASDIKEPRLPEGLKALRAEFRFAATPVVLIAKPGDARTVRELVRGDNRLGEVGATPTPVDVSKALARVSHTAGLKAITADVGTQLAADAVSVLRLLAETNNPVFNVADAEPALLAAFGTTDPELRVAIAEALGYLGSGKAQEAIARAALDAAAAEDMRVKMFAALAEAAKRRGNLLGPELIGQLVKIAESDANMTIRGAASRALGALNLPSAPASEIIRNQYRG
jgi:HEAT repeat protein